MNLNCGSRCCGISVVISSSVDKHNQWTPNFMEAIWPDNLSKIISPLRLLLWFESHIICVFIIEPREKQNSRPYEHLHSIRLNNGGKVKGVLLMPHIANSPFDCHRWFEIGNCDWWVVYVCVALEYLWAACIQPREGKNNCPYFLFAVANIAEEDDIISGFHLINKPWINCS